jgi:hypothetical protein
MNFDLFVKDLKKINGLEELYPDDKGTYSLSINQHHLVYFAKSFDGQDFYLYAPIGHFPHDNEEKLDLMEKLLKANAFGKETGHSYFAFDRYQILLILRISVQSLSKERFISELNPFVSCLAHWKNSVEKLPYLHANKKEAKENFMHIKI